MTFNETIYVTGGRGSNAVVVNSCHARIIDDGVADDVTEGMRGVNNDMITCFVKVTDWADTNKPQVGDTIRRECSDVRYVVGRVTRLGDCYSISARSR